MTRQFTREDWGRYAECYDVLNSLIPYREMLKDVASKLSRGDLPLLDAGCGTGNLICRLHKAGWDGMIGADSSTAMLKRAKAKCPHASFVLADVGKGLPLRSSVFGAIACINTLYTIAQPENMLREFFHLLRQKGKLVLVTPKRGYENGLILRAHCKSTKPESFWLNAHSSAEREAALIHEAVGDGAAASQLRRLALFNRRISLERNFRFFTAKELAVMVEHCGFRHDSVTTTYAHQNLLLTAERT